MSPPNSIRVMLIDDHRSVHEMVESIFHTVNDIKLVAQGSNGEDALQLFADARPDVVLMDVVMPRMDGVEATRQLHEQDPSVKILVLSSFQDDESVRQMLNNGAAGYILKGSLLNDLVPTIRSIYTGQSVFSPQITQTLLKSPDAKKDFRLTDREREILKLVASGMNNNEVAASLVISTSTVKFHINNILLKMQVDTRAEAIVLAAKNNLV